MTRTHLTTCPICEAGCGIEVSIDEAGAVTGIRGDKDFAPTQGFICPKGAALKELHHDPDRLTKPMVRKNGKLVEASWDEALKRMRELLQPIIEAGGPDAVAFDNGNPATHNYGTWIYSRPAMKMARIRNIFTTGTVDHIPMMAASALMFGGQDNNSFTVPTPDLDHCDLLILIGTNPLVSNATGVTTPRGRIQDVQARGGRVIVIDPRRTETAKIADQHLAVKPGGDAYLLSAVVNVILSENLTRLDDIEQHLNGLEDLRTAVVDFTPERVAASCGISAEEIRSLARDIASTDRVATYGRTGMMLNPFGSINMWMMYALAAITGNLDREGGVMFPMPAAAIHNTRGTPGIGPKTVFGRWRTLASGHPEVLGELPVAALPEEIEVPGSKIRALITIASNRARSGPDTDSFERAVQKLDAMISIDIYLNETTQYADVILPPPSPLEKNHFDMFYEQLFSSNHTRYATAAFPVPEGALSEHEIMMELSAVLGGVFGATRDQMDDLILSALVHDIVDEPGSVIGSLDPHDVLDMLGPERGPDRGLDLMLRIGPYGDAFGLKPDGLTLAKLKAQSHGIEFGALQPRLPEVLRTPTGRVELAPKELVADMERAKAGLDVDKGLLLIGRRHTRSNNSWLHNLPLLVKGKPRCAVQLHPKDAEAHGITEGAMVRITSEVNSIEAVAELTEDMSAGVISLPHGWGHGASGARLSVAEQNAGVNANRITGPAGLDVVSGNAALNAVPVSLELA